jgi:hypothetical protein
MLHSRPGTVNSTLLDCLLGYSGTSYNSSAWTPQKTLVTCRTESALVLYQHWAWLGRHRRHSLIYRWTVFTEPLPGNALIKSVILCTRLLGVVSQKKLIFIVTAMRIMRYFLDNHSSQTMTLIRSTMMCRK